MTNLRGITWEHPRGHGSMAAAAARYHQLTDHEVRWDHRSLQAFADAPLADLASAYDLLVIDHPHIPLAADQGLLAPLDGVGYDDQLAELARHSVGASHRSYTHAGHQWALANDAAAQVAAYRPDLISDPPRDWDGVLALAGEGRVLWPAKPIDAYSSLLTIAAGNGTPPNSRPGVFLDAQDAYAALERLHQLAAQVPSDCLVHNPIEVAERLAAGDTYAYCPLLFGYTNYSRAGFRRHRLRYIDIPCDASGPRGSLLGGAGIAVSAYAGDVDAARAFAFWVASAEAQAGVYFDGGGQPGHALAWEDERLNAETLDFFRGTRATLEQGYVRPRTVGYMAFQDAMSPLVTATLQGQLSDDELLSRLNDSARRWLQEDEHADR
ncbi:extracellular solute-binding protein [Actinopolymorpha alba]|uniref:extracellular solute-binding protein n=1 Tax=Actinopolymorpha alba TaxID=533267 RepID=UPI0003608A4C|nr:extracellular solute-binding protein [Actinopolymorpha alba]